MIGKSHKLALRHRDRWRVEDMLKEQSDLLRKDLERDMDLWRHLFAPDDLVRVGSACRVACEAVAAEWCSGNTWNDEVIVATTVVCWPALALLHGTTCKEPMSRAQACEAVLGRLRAAGTEIAMVVEDGGGALECWVDSVPGSFPMHSSGRCPGGINSRTGVPHRVVWAHPVTRIAREDDDWSVREAAQDGSQQERF
jgi:hypothetical protein